MVCENGWRGGYHPHVPGTVSVDGAGAQCAPLQTGYRNIPVDEGQAGEDTGPYGGLRKATKKCHHQARRLCRISASEMTFKFRRQVVAR